MRAEPDTRPTVHPYALETALLLHCASSASEDAVHARAILSAPLDWAYLLWMAHRQGLLPLLYWHVRTAGMATTPVVEQLAEHFATNARRNTRLLTDLCEILKHYAAAGLAVLPLRVPFLLARAYQYPGLRQAEPLDLLIPPHDAVRAEEVLVAHGYQPVHTLTAGQHAALRRSRGVVFQHRLHRGRIQLQECVAPVYVALGLTAADLWRRCQTLSLGTVTVPCPAVEDLIVLTCAHGALNLWSRLAWVADLARVIAACQPVDWDQLLARARAARAERMLHVGLALLHELSGSALPAELRQRIAADRRAAALVAEARRRILGNLHGWTSERERARFRLHVREHPLDRLHYALRFALTPTVEDWQTLPLPDALLPLYHLVRPLRLARALRRGTAPPLRAPYMSTPLPVIERMLALAEVRPSDMVYDLGCGDGRIVIAAAQRYGARGVGIDIDAQRIVEARANARAAGVDHLVAFVQGDVLDLDLRPATVVTLWMLQTLNYRLRPKLRAELRPGARIVGHSFDLGDWVPTRTALMSHADENVILYLWTVDRSPG